MGNNIIILAAGNYEYMRRGAKHHMWHIGSALGANGCIFMDEYLTHTHRDTDTCMPVVDTQ